MSAIAKHVKVQAIDNATAAKMLSEDGFVLVGVTLTKITNASAERRSKKI